MLEVLSSLVTRVMEPSAGDEAGDEGDCVAEQAIALLNNKECVACLMQVGDTSIEQTRKSESEGVKSDSGCTVCTVVPFLLSSNIWNSSLIFSLSEKNFLVCETIEKNLSVTKSS